MASANIDDDYGLGATPPKSGSIDRFRFMTEHDMMNMPPPKWQVNGILQEKTTNLIYGGKGSLKTFFILGMAMCMTYDLPFHGRAVKPGAVAYVCGEGGAAIGKRIHAWRQAHDIDGARKSPFYILNRPVRIYDGEEVDAFIQHINRMQIEMNVKFRMVVFDTMSKMLGGQKEDNDVFAKVIGHADRIRDVLETCVVIIHHAGKDEDKGARGGSAAGCDTDAVFRMTRGKVGTPERSEIALYAEKVKDAPDDWTKHYRAKLISLPRREGDEDEQPDSLILEEFDKTNPHYHQENRAMMRMKITERMGAGRHSLSAISVAMAKSKGSFNDAIRDAIAEERTLVHTPSGKYSVMRVENPANKGATIVIESVTT
jgi:RecA-family ATPase